MPTYFHTGSKTPSYLLTYFHQKPNCQWIRQPQSSRCDNLLQFFLVQSSLTALCKSTFKKIYQPSKIKHFLNLQARKLFFHAHWLRINTWDSASANILKRLVSLLKRALKARHSGKLYIPILGPKHIKGSKERYLLGQNTTCKPANP